MLFGAGPVYSELGRIILLFALCSNACAAQPAARDIINNGRII